MASARDAVTDPVCGMAITASTAIAIEHDGQTFHFCESACAAIFREEPERWITRRLEPEHR